ncbi:MAG TPA: hypothetical protein VE641_08710, partial [Chthoniobacterales bacterium]|nr:hypothetical protein [Chthoniobacterales bacterium]
KVAPKVKAVTVNESPVRVTYKGSSLLSALEEAGLALSNLPATRDPRWRQRRPVTKFCGHLTKLVSGSKFE